MTYGFLPATKEEFDRSGIGVPDFVYVSGDAYVDHPSFGAAIITRILDAAGFSVCRSRSAELSFDRGFHALREAAPRISRFLGKRGFDGRALYRRKEEALGRLVFTRQARGTPSPTVRS